MRKNAFVASEHILELNKFRIHTIEVGDLPLSETDFREAFKVCGIPSNPMFFSEFKNSGLLTRVEGDMFVWRNNLPIHHKILQKIYTRYQERVNKNCRAYRERKRKERVFQSKGIAEAIALLKSKGFEVFAPKGDLYQKL